MIMPFILLWLTLGFVGAAVLVIVFFWIAGRYLKDD
jgi:hypothetical protein